MITLMIFSLIAKFALSILMIIVGLRELSLSHKGSRVFIGTFLVFVGVIGYVSSFF
jgi:hypothetical protein